MIFLFVLSELAMKSFSALFNKSSLPLKCPFPYGPSHFSTSASTRKHFSGLDAGYLDLLNIGLAGFNITIVLQLHPRNGLCRITCSEMIFEQYQPKMATYKMHLPNCTLFVLHFLNHDKWFPRLNVLRNLVSNCL